MHQYLPQIKKSYAKKERLIKRRSSPCEGGFHGEPEAEGPKNFLSHRKSGPIQSDGYTGYDQLFSGEGNGRIRSVCTPHLLTSHTPHEMARCILPSFPQEFIRN